MRKAQNDQGVIGGSEKWSVVCAWGHIGFRHRCGWIDQEVIGIRVIPTFLFKATAGNSTVCVYVCMYVCMYVFMYVCMDLFVYK